ncbi:MAG: hypothetical protein H3C62_16805 [Gemmatimonadaceae bacterium]|nr:hypothetical protein [Gemmatimonadaceae bacterium]
MTHPALDHVIGHIRPRKPEPVSLNFGLFAQPAAPPEPPALTWANKYAQLSAGSRDFATLKGKAEAAMHAILNAFGSATIWEVRLALGEHGFIANDGKEKLDGLGGLAQGMGLVAVDTERPPSWAMGTLEKSHGNRNVVWCRPADVDRYQRADRRRRLAQERPEAA